MAGELVCEPLRVVGRVVVAIGDRLERGGVAGAAARASKPPEYASDRSDAHCPTCLPGTVRPHGTCGRRAAAAGPARWKRFLSVVIT